MRLKRYKRFQKVIAFYERNYNFRKPFQILIDGTFAQAALTNKVNIQEQLPKYFDCPTKIVTTSCIQIEVQNLGVHGALHILKQYQCHKCSHQNKPVPAVQCIESMVSGQDRYFIASQDPGVKTKLRNQSGVPILYLHGNSMVLEKPSFTTSKNVTQSSLEKLEVTGYQKEILDVLKDKSGIITAKVSEDKKKRKRKRKEPNPLSCKKSKKKKTTVNNKMNQIQNKAIDKKKRKRIRVNKGPKS